MSADAASRFAARLTDLIQIHIQINRLSKDEHLLITLNVVFASSAPAPIRLETIQVVAHAQATDAASVKVGCTDASKAHKTAA